jgi:hypothetical protein
MVRGSKLMRSPEEIYTLAIERSLLKNFFGEIFSVIKDLKTQQSQIGFTLEEIQHNDRPKRKFTVGVKYTVDSSESEFKSEEEEQQGKYKK